MKKLILQYKHAFYLLYFLVYLACFSYLEKKVTTRFYVIQMEFDSYIPFCEYFIIPYFLWFLFMGITVVYFVFQGNRKEYYQFLTFLYIGMTVFLIICYIYPNGHYLRPRTFPRDNICTQLVSYLYSIDTSTNVLPSIHVYNTLGAWIAISNSAVLKKHKVLQVITSILCFTIILSTMFLKQHSVIDVIAALGIGLVSYVIVYVPFLSTNSKVSSVKI